MEDSILNDVKKPLGVLPEYKHFDAEIIMHINSVFMILMQMGVGPVTGFSIKDDTTTWSDFTKRSDLESLKTYIYLKVRLLFDPPTNSFLVKAIEDQIAEYEWRLNFQVDDGSGE